MPFGDIREKKEAINRDVYMVDSMVEEGELKNDFPALRASKKVEFQDFLPRKETHWKIEGLDQVREGRVLLLKLFS